MGESKQKLYHLSKAAEATTPHRVTTGIGEIAGPRSLRRVELLPHRDMSWGIYFSLLLPVVGTAPVRSAAVSV